MTADITEVAGGRRDFQMRHLSIVLTSTAFCVPCTYARALNSPSSVLLKIDCLQDAIVPKNNTINVVKSIGYFHVK